MPTPGFEAAFHRSMHSLARRMRPENEHDPGDLPTKGAADGPNAIANFLKLQGLMIAHLAMEPETSDELIGAAVHAAERVPAWMEMQVFGMSDDPGRQFARGCAQLLAKQRAALERIVEDQIEDPEPIEEIFAEWPLPPEDAEGDGARLFHLAGVALQGNFRAALVIARDLDEWIEEVEARREAEDEEEE